MKRLKKKLNNNLKSSLPANMPDDPFPESSASLNGFPSNQLRLLVDLDDEGANESTNWLPGQAKLEQWVLAALSVNVEQAERTYHVEVSLSCVTRKAIRELNAQYRNKDTSTNVLSFPADMPVVPADNPAELSVAILGDVVICPDVLTEEATQQEKSIEHHWAHMVVHSVLHLKGLDHQDENSAEAMESLEIQILSELGINNPYLAAPANQP